MRFTSVRFLAYTIALAIPAVAQPTPMSSEMTHAELSVGVDGMSAGPAGDLARGMTQILPPPTVVSGLFAQVNVGKSRHTMIGFFTGSDGRTAYGQVPEGGSVSIHANVRTRAVLASFRPTAWVKVALGPAIVRRRVEFRNDGQTFASPALGWIAAADVKFLRRPVTPLHPPRFGYVTAQYRGVPALDVPATPMTVYDKKQQTVWWPAQRVRMSHWMIGVGFGFEI
jgi:hypothetical protein